MRITSGAFRGRALRSPSDLLHHQRVSKSGTSRHSSAIPHSSRGTLSSQHVSASITHPMGDREKLALFNAISARISLENVRVLDLFAGSGALGLEALSRGAAFVVFIDNDSRAIDAIKHNIKELGVSGKTKVLRASASAVSTASLGQFDLILVDPPYDKFTELFDEHLVGSISDHLSDSGLLALSHPTASSPNLPGLTPIFAKKYAAAHLTIYQKQ